MRHEDHGPDVICRPAFGTGLCEPLEPAVTSEFHFYRLTDKVARDAIRQACAEAQHGPVWLVNKAGKRIGKIVAPEARVMRDADEAEDVW